MKQKFHNQVITPTKLLFISFMLLLPIFVWQLAFAPKAHAAAISVTGACTLDDAVASVNAASDQSGCTGSGAYGTNDTIDIPAGVHSYSATTDITEKPVTVQGAGMGQTIIDSGDANTGLHFVNNTGSPLFSNRSRSFYSWY